MEDHATHMRPIEQSSFLIAANGSVDAPPAAGLSGVLAPRAASLTAVFHPLNPEDPPAHRVLRWERGEQVADDEIRLPSRPPYTYLLDVVAPMRRPAVDAWFAFNNLSAAHGIARRRLGRVKQVAYWAVDFVPNRFGEDSLLTRAYQAVDRFASSRADLRIEVTEAARVGRAALLGLNDDPRRVRPGPMGLWLERLPRTAPDAWKKRRVVYSGHLVARQGVTKLVEAMKCLPDVQLDIIGRGPLEGELRAQCEKLDISDRVRFLGYFPDHADVERAVAAASVAVAPYATDPGSFSRYADPSKIRLYAGVGLPVVTTRVPPMIDQLEREAGVTVVDYDATEIAQAIERLLSSPEEWAARRSTAVEYASRYDWPAIIRPLLEALGYC